MPKPRTDPAVKKAIGAAIRSFREQRGLKQSALADLVGVRPLAMYRYESGRVMPGTMIMGRIAEALGVPESALKRAEGRKLPSLEAPGAGLPESPDAQLLPEQQLEMFGALEAAGQRVNPIVRRAWALHIAGWGASQRITRLYMVRFIEAAETEIEQGNREFAMIAEMAGEFAFNAAVEAHARKAGHKSLRRRRR